MGGGAAPPYLNFGRADLRVRPNISQSLLTAPIATLFRSKRRGKTNYCRTFRATPRFVVFGVVRVNILAFGFKHAERAAALSQKNVIGAAGFAVDSKYD